MRKYSELKLILRYRGGDADDHKLDLYDASKSMKGLSQILHIVSNALITEGEIKQRYTSTKGVDFYFESARKGSLVETISIIIDNEILKDLALTSITIPFWEMMKYTLKKSVGKKHVPQSRTVRRILKNNPQFDKKIAQALQIPLVEFHRPVTSDSSVEISIERLRGEKIAEFDVETLDYVSKDPDPIYETDIIGNVTRFNVLSLKGGRIYSVDEKRTITFVINENLDSIQRGILSTSLDRYTNGLPSSISIDAYVHRDKTGKIKRYQIEKVQPRYKD